MARSASSAGGAEGDTGAEEEGSVQSSTAVVGAPFGDFTADEERRFLASADGDKVEAMRRYKACLVRGGASTYIIPTSHEQRSSHPFASQMVL